MNPKHDPLDSQYLDRQRTLLQKLQEELSGVRTARTDEQAAAQGELAGQAREYEDDAQKLTTLELQENIAAVDDERLGNIKRALQKIDEGTYGLSDASGKRIPPERLAAIPEAIYTVEEQSSRDAVR